LIETSSSRNFFELSQHVAAIHQELAGRFCTRSRENLTAALEAIGPFLANNNNARFSREDAAIVEVAKSIRHRLTALVSL